MCKDFSCWVTRDHSVIWERGVSSHDSLYSKYLDQYPAFKETGHRNGLAVKVEITPDKGYLYPEKGWTLKIDDDQPSWWSASHETEAMRALKKWKAQVYQLINLKEARHPINPLNSKRKPTKKDIQLLEDWASVWSSLGNSMGNSVENSVGASVWSSLENSVGSSLGSSLGNSVGSSVWSSLGSSSGDSVGNSVWNSVWAYIGSLFYIWNGNYKFQPAVDLWKRGFVPSFDGTRWRLHSGKKADIVYEQAKCEEIK
jgi:hypothetical protein